MSEWIPETPQCSNFRQSPIACPRVMCDYQCRHPPYAEGAYTAPGVSPHSIPAGVPPLRISAEVNLPAIHNIETPAPEPATVEIPTTKAINSINTKMDNMIKAFEAGTFQLSTATEPRHGVYQTARAYTIQANYPPPHIPMSLTPANVP